MSNIFTLSTPSTTTDRYCLPPVLKMKAFAQKAEVLNDALDDKNDAFYDLAERIKNTSYAIVIRRAVDSEKNLILKLDLNPSWNCITLFFNKIVSWFRDNASNRLIKENFVKYIIDKLGNADDAKTDAIRKSLTNIVDPTSGWPLDLRVVKKFVDETASYSCQIDPQVKADEKDNLTTPCKQVMTVDEGFNLINRNLLSEFSEAKEEPI